jgi:hypothetical protein
MKDLSFNPKYFLLLWLINPFLSGVFLIRRMSAVDQIYPFLFLSFFLGISFVIAPESGADSVRYAQELKNLHANSISFFDYVGGIYTEESTKLDWYQPAITWLVSRFTRNFQWLFGIYAVVFGYFWFKSLLMVRNWMPSDLSPLLWLTLIFLALINPIWSINGVRMWTAVQVFFYGILLIYFSKDKKGYAFLFFSIFIHFSLSIAVIVYFIFRLFPFKNISILFVLYIITFFVGELNLAQIREFFEQLPGFMQSKKGYLNEEYVQNMKNAKMQYAFHIQFYRSVLKYLMLFFCTFLYLKYKKGEKELSLFFIQFFSLALFFSIFSRILSNIPSGGRFGVLSNLLMTTSFLFYLVKSEGSNLSLYYSRVLMVFLLFLVVVQVRTGMDYIGLLFFVGNPVLNFMVEDTVPLIDFVKSIF